MTNRITLTSRTCDYCGGPIGDHLRWGTRFCSTECRKKWNNRNRPSRLAERLARAAANAVKPGIEKNCVACGVSFVAISKKRQYCSKACSHVLTGKVRSQRLHEAAALLESSPTYSRYQLTEARFTLEQYGKNPALAKGREMMLKRAEEIIAYWRRRDALSQWLEHQRAVGRESQARYMAKRRAAKCGKAATPKASVKKGIDNSPSV